MIVTGLWNLVHNILTGLLGLLPDMEPPDIAGYLDALDPMWSYIAWANKYLPLVEMFGLLALLWGVRIAMAIVQFAIWVWGKIPVIGNGD